ncbi:hypothetical protein NA57DRAFT_80638 [Rhizodiscina lignyota]|uniref:F-box domain-containing protein n=1 Tax=Rhizodiscina lignyota TaxID=1504668 RepID=A0A9P4I799_9PEZI|nr:hypothetical protein NA57DRAFT_80638 [Rhizodiscina lignyota]
MPDSVDTLDAEARASSTEHDERNSTSTEIFSPLLRLPAELRLIIYELHLASKVWYDPNSGFYRIYICDFRVRSRRDWLRSMFHVNRQLRVEFSEYIRKTATFAMYTFHSPSELMALSGHIRSLMAHVEIRNHNYDNVFPTFQERVENLSSRNGFTHLQKLDLVVECSGPRECHGIAKVVSKWFKLHGTPLKPLEEGNESLKEVVVESLCYHPDATRKRVTWFRYFRVGQKLVRDTEVQAEMVRRT